MARYGLKFRRIVRTSWKMSYSTACTRTLELLYVQHFVRVGRFCGRFVCTLGYVCVYIVCSLWRGGVLLRVFCVSTNCASCLFVCVVPELSSPDLLFACELYRRVFRAGVL